MPGIEGYAVIWTRGLSRNITWEAAGEDRFLYYQEPAFVSGFLYEKKSPTVYRESYLILGCNSKRIQIKEMARMLIELSKLAE